MWQRHCNEKLVNIKTGRSVILYSVNYFALLWAVWGTFTLYSPFKIRNNRAIRCHKVLSNAIKGTLWNQPRIMQSSFISTHKPIIEVVAFNKKAVSQFLWFILRLTVGWISLYSSSGKRTGWGWFVKYLKERGHVCSMDYPVFACRRTEENEGSARSGWPMTRPRFETGIFRMQDEKRQYSACFGWYFVFYVVFITYCFCCNNL